MEQDGKAAPGPGRWGRDKHTQTWVPTYTACWHTQRPPDQGHGWPGADMLSSYPSGADVTQTLLSFLPEEDERKLWLGAHLSHSLLLTYLCGM